MFWECNNADCMGPHHRGKNGKSGRGTWPCPRGSVRLRPGIGDRDRSESAMVDRARVSRRATEDSIRLQKLNQYKWMICNEAERYQDHVNELIKYETMYNVTVQQAESLEEQSNYSGAWQSWHVIHMTQSSNQCNNDNAVACQCQIGASVQFSTKAGPGFPRNVNSGFREMPKCSTNTQQLRCRPPLWPLVIPTSWLMILSPLVNAAVVAVVRGRFVSVDRLWQILPF